MSDSKEAGRKKARPSESLGARKKAGPADAQDVWTFEAPESRRARRRKAQNAWWAGPVSAALACTLLVVGLYVADRLGDYRAFLQKRAQVDRATFYPGLTIDGVDVSDMDYSTALAHFQALDQQRESAYFVELTYGQQKWTLEADDFGYQSDYRQIVEGAWAVGRYGSFEERYTAVSRAAGEWSRNYPIAYSIDRNRLLERLRPIAAGLTQPGSNASVHGFSTTKLKFSFDEGVIGYVVDAEKLTDQVLNKVDQGGGRSIRR